MSCLACVAGIKGVEDREEGNKGGALGREGKGRLLKESPFVHSCGRWRLQIPDWLSRNE